MQQAAAIVEGLGGGRRYLPFATQKPDAYVCFDRQGDAKNHELPIIEWSQGMVRQQATHFGEWLDMVADEREEAIDRAASIPPSLKKLLVQLGFTFDDPIAGRLETGDIAAIEELLGAEQASQVRGTIDRLFDSSGKASITLNLDEFTLAVSLRSGIFLFEAEDVFRWLRHFRDENFFGEIPRAPSHPDNVRDLRAAPREPPMVYRGISEVALCPARRHMFRAAAGTSANDFWVLGRTGSTHSRSPSLLVHVIDKRVVEALDVDEPLNDLYVTGDSTLWGLSHSGIAVRIIAGMARTFTLERPTRGRAAWYGIGHGGDRVMVWGAGALLEFDGERMQPFSPDAGLLPEESVIALVTNGKRDISMLVQGDHLGAVARFDGRAWRPIPEHQVIEAALTDLDVWRDVAMVLGKGGRVWRIEKDGPPRPMNWDRRQQAFQTEDDVPRAMHQIRGFDGGTMLASDGGVIVVGSGEPVFHMARGTTETARIARIGSTRRAPQEGDCQLVAVVGPNVWIWERGQFTAVDVTRY